MAEVFTQEWADEVRAAVNSFPDPEYKATKLDMFWDWITVARKGFNGAFALGARDLNKFVKFTIDAGECTKAEIVEGAPEDATYILNGDLDVWRDIIDNDYDCGKAVMYRRFRLEQGDVFRFFNRIYFFTESLVALSKVPATLPA
jgi:putative sterol carrier protein